MKALRTLVTYALLTALALGTLSVLRPFWDRYWIQRDMEAAAIYGTKNSEEATLARLAGKMRQEGRGFTEQDFAIDKDRDRKVTITLHYKDHIGLFGVELKELRFTLTASATEIKEYY